MYLSKLALNPRHRQTLRDLGNPYSMHATLCWAFRKPGVDEVPARERGKTIERFLWRLEQAKGESILLVQSLTLPDWQALLTRHPGYSVLDQDAPKYVDLSTLETRLQRNPLLRFRLRANPTVTKFDPEKGKGKRLGLVKLEDQLAWLRRQGEQHGFNVVGAMVSGTDRIRAPKRKQGNEERVITLQGVTYDGHLRVTDPDPFLSTLQSGLGHAKALGFGLLSVGPAR